MILLLPNDDFAYFANNLNFDLNIINAIQNTCYLQGWNNVSKARTFHLSIEYAQNSKNHYCFIYMFCILPIFLTLFST